MNVVLDASALLALAFGEPGGDIVAQRLDGAHVSAVNLSEVSTRLIESGLPADGVRRRLSQLSVAVDAFEGDQLWRCAALRARHRRDGLSFADCACLALGAERALPVLTGDRRWTELDHGVDVELFR